MMEWNRRRFLQMAGGTSLLAVAGNRLTWAEPATRFVYIGAEDAIHVYSLSGKTRLHKIQQIQSSRPVSMKPGNGKLFVANGVAQVGNLPRGSVEAFAIDTATGRLAPINRVGLSLSGTEPRDLAVAPDGQSLVVAIHGGGAYNVVAINGDGQLGGVTGILKEIGAGPHALQASAHPSAVTFGRQGHVLAADMGADRLSVFSLVNGELSVVSRGQANAGSGPGSLALHPDGEHVYVAHALDGTLSSYALTSAGTLSHKQSLRVASETARLAMHPSGTALYSSHGHAVQSWKLGGNGSFETAASVPLRAKNLQVTPDGRNLVALTPSGIVAIDLERATAPVELASLPNPLSIAIV
jgi:6-phosphogluconolactonase